MRLRVLPLAAFALAILPAATVGANAFPNALPAAGHAASVAAPQDAHLGGAGHSDQAPPGVNVHQALSVAALYAKARLPQRPGTPAMRLTTPLTVAPGVVAAPAPTGQPGSPMLTQHVAPSCTGTGADGNRVQVLYAHESGTTDRYTQVLAVVRNEVANVDDTFALSARETDGGRRVRWVHDANCLPVIDDVTLPAGSLGPDFGPTVDALTTAGYNDPARKYLVFADAAQLCGIAQSYDDPSTTQNDNDGYAAAMVARVDTDCWSNPSHSTPAHELMHNLGAVLSDAPNATGNGHCNDESDVMCYADGGLYDTMRQVCPTWHEYLYDCGHDDYFSTAPTAGSYLDTHWNTATSSFLDDAPVLAAAPVITTSSAPAAPQTGDVVTLTATAPGATTFTWSGPYLGTPVTQAGQSTVTAVAPSYGVGAHTYTVTAATPDGVAGAATVEVNVTAVAANPTGSPVPPVVQGTNVDAWAVVGYPTTVYGLLRTNDGAPLASQPVTLQVWWSGARGWATVTTLGTDGAGQVAFRYNPIRLGAFRFVYAGSATTDGSTSGNVYVKVPTRISLAVRAGRPDILSGRATTSAGASLIGATVALQYHLAGSSAWHTVTVVRSNRSGGVAARVQPRRGVYYRWVWNGNGTYYGAASGQGYVRY